MAQLVVVNQSGERNDMVEITMQLEGLPLLTVPEVAPESEVRLGSHGSIVRRDYRIRNGRLEFKETVLRFSSSVELESPLDYSI